MATFNPLPNYPQIDPDGTETVTITTPTNFWTTTINKIKLFFQTLEWNFSQNITAATAVFGGATDNATFEADGTLKFNGDATFWVDIDFPLVVRTGGANRPTYENIQGDIVMLQWKVNDYADTDSQEFIHGWKEGSQVTFHIHVITGGTDATDRYIQFELQYFWANFAQQISAPITVNSGDLLIPANTPIHTHRVYNIQAFTPVGGNIAAHIKARVKRIAATGTAPTANIYSEMLQLHVECDTLGSREIITK